MHGMIAIDTSIACTCAISVAGKTLLIHRKDPRPAETLIPEIDAWTKKEQVSLLDVKEIRVGLGPGTFTGVRLGVNMAKAFSFSIGRDPLAQSTPKLLYEQSHKSPGALYAVIIEAYQGEVFFVLYDGDTGNEIIPLQHVKKDQMLLHLQQQSKPLVLLGPMALVAKDALSDAHANFHVSVDETCLVLNPEKLLSLPADAWCTHDRITLEPLYIRPPDAMLPRGKA